MSIVLSSAEVQDLQAALRVLVAPLAYPDVVRWSEAATESCRKFLRADQALFGMMTADRMVVFPQGDRAADAAASYMSHYWRHDFVLTERRFQLGRETYHRDMLYRPGEIEKCVVYNEWSVPNRFCDTIGMSVEATNPMLAGVHFYHDTETGEFRERGVELLDLLLPAFRAGIYTWLTLGKRASALTALLEAADTGVLVASLAGEVLHESPALARTLRDDPERVRLRREMLDSARTLGTMVQRARRWTPDGEHPFQQIARELRTARALYQISASYVPEGTIAPSPAVAVTLRCRVPHMLPDQELRERFSLTARQLEVAKHIAHGRKNDEIATRLGISPATALRHTEAVLQKLGVHSRAAVASVLLGS